MHSIHLLLSGRYDCLLERSYLLQHGRNLPRAVPAVAAPKVPP